MESKMLDTYADMFAFIGMEATSDGYVRMSTGDGNYLPVIAKDGQPVVLPTMDRLRDKDVQNHSVFHLFSEQTNQDNLTDLMSRYRHWAINRVNIVIGGLGAELLRVAASSDIAKRLRPDQKEYLPLVENADEVAYKTFDKIAEEAAKVNQLNRVFVTMYLKPAAVIDKKTFNRGATVDFPFYNDLVALMASMKEKKEAKNKHAAKIENEVFGVHMRNKDHDILEGLMRYLLPNLDVPGFYSVGSNSRIAPAVDAMMRGFLPIARHLNAVMDLFRGVDTDFDRTIDEMYFNLDWAAAFENLDVLWNDIRMVPAQQQATSEEPMPTAPTNRNLPPQPQQHQQHQHQMPRSPAPWEAPAPTYAQQQQNQYERGYGAPAPQQYARPGQGGGASVNSMMMARGSRGPANGPQGGYPQQGAYNPHPNTGMTGGYPAPGNYGGGTRSRY